MGFRKVVRIRWFLFHQTTKNILFPFFQKMYKKLSLFPTIPLRNLCRFLSLFPISIFSNLEDPIRNSQGSNFFHPFYFPKIYFFFEKTHFLPFSSQPLRSSREEEVFFCILHIKCTYLPSYNTLVNVGERRKKLEKNFLTETSQLNCTSESLTLSRREVSKTAKKVSSFNSTEQSKAMLAQHSTSKKTIFFLWVWM